MSFWDSVKSVGSKFIDTVETVGSKGLHTVNTIGGKVKNVAEDLLKNPVVDSFLVANPEIGGFAVGALGALESGLAVTGEVEKGLNEFTGAVRKSGILKDKPSDEKASDPVADMTVAKGKAGSLSFGQSPVSRDPVAQAGISRVGPTRSAPNVAPVRGVQRPSATSKPQHNIGLGQMTTRRSVHDKLPAVLPKGGMRGRQGVGSKGPRTPSISDFVLNDVGIKGRPRGSNRTASSANPARQNLQRKTTR